MTLDRYMARRRWWEVAMFVGFSIVIFAANVAVEMIDSERLGRGVPLIVPVIAEGTSHVAMLLTIPLVLWFDRHFTLGGERWLRNLGAHALFSVVFSLAHVTMMYWMRVGLYRIGSGGERYHWENWWGEFGYEYLKDFRTYIVILALVYLYRFVLRRLQGEAGFLAENDTSAATNSDRFLVKKLGREFLVRIDEIDWIESCGNYVNLHVGDRVYPLRETMIRIDERLVPLGFQRVHRSAIVNLDRVAEIEAFESGDGRARLNTDVTVPVSRRFRQELRERLS
jgi:hypothetical protein